VTTTARPRLAWLLTGLVLVLVAAVAVVLLREEPQRASVDPDRTSARSGDRAAATGDLVERLERAVSRGVPAAAERLADPEDARARKELRTLARNAASLRIVDVALRYVAEADRRLGGPEERRYGQDAWVSDVQLSWRLGDSDRTVSTVDVPLVASWSGGDAVFETVRLGGEARVPLWLLGGLERRDVADVTVLAPRSRLGLLARQAVRAARTVRRTVPGWRGPLVVEAAPAPSDFRAASGLGPEAVEQIAAVTATTDGTTGADVPVHVFVNPAVYTPLGPRGQQIVLSHEAAHVALGAVRTKAPLWLSEGVADYVALVDSPLPVSVLAAQILRRVRDEGVPRTLPGPAEFEAGDDALGAWYEAAWLATRLVAEEHGEQRLLDLYRRADRTGSMDTAFREVLGTSQRAFERSWQRYLRGLAG